MNKDANSLGLYIWETRLLSIVQCFPDHLCYTTSYECRDTPPIKSSDSNLGPPLPGSLNGSPNLQGWLMILFFQPQFSSGDRTGICALCQGHSIFYIADTEHPRLRWRDWEQQIRCISWPANYLCYLTRIRKMMGQSCHFHSRMRTVAFCDR